MDGSWPRRSPVRSETDALYVTCGVGALIAASVIVGALIDPLVGVALFVGGVGGAMLWELGTEDPRSRAAAARGLDRRPARRPAARARGREPHAGRRGRERLAAALAWARAEGLEADGKVGDPFTAFDAVEDELRAFGPTR